LEDSRFGWSSFRGAGHREALEAAGTAELLIKVLLRGLRDEDIRVALEAYDRAAGYLYGRPGTLEMGPEGPTTIPPLEEVRRALGYTTSPGGHGAT